MTENRTTELLPCPFCGGEAEIVSLHQCEERPVGICCSKCPAIFADGSTYSGFKEYNTEAEAIAAWNTRHVETCSGELDYDSWFFCSNCGCQTKADQYGEKPNYCASCGCKVVSE